MDNGAGGGDCLDVTDPVTNALAGICEGTIRVGALIGGTYRGGRMEIAIDQC